MECLKNILFIKQLSAGNCSF